MLVMCKCRYCKAKLRTKWGSEYARCRTRAHRHQVRQLLRQGEQYDIPDRFSLGYMG